MDIEAQGEEGIFPRPRSQLLADRSVPWVRTVLETCGKLTRLKEPLEMCHSANTGEDALCQRSCSEAGKGLNDKTK